MDEKELNNILSGIYDGEISVLNMEPLFFEFSFEQLMKITDRGFKKGEMILNKAAIYEGFRKNINEFCGAKSVSQYWNLQRAVFDQDGTKREFSEFLDIAKGIDQKYNGLREQSWLLTEQNTAFAQAQAADQWVRTEQMSETFPLLQYQTVGDQRVRPEHRLWDGVIRPVNDEFWQTRYPPNDWNCRCIVIRLRRGQITNLKHQLDKVNKELEAEGLTPFKSMKNTSKVFNTNPAKSKYIFKESETQYFADAKEAKVKKGKNNYGFGYK